MRLITSVLSIVVALGLVAGCESTPEPPATVRAQSFEAKGFTHKMLKATGESQFTTLAYDCRDCTFEQWLAIEPPSGWSKGPAQVLLADSGEMRSRPSFDGVPSAMDFIAEVPGAEYELIAKTLDAKMVSAGPAGIIARAKVMRDNVLTFNAGRRVHELTTPDGDVFVLFAYQVDPANVVIPDVKDPNMLGDFKPPTGWAHTSRVLDEPLRLDTSDVAEVLAVRTAGTSTWELRK